MTAGLLLALSFAAPIDRDAMVRRHAMTGGPATVWPVGNGEFCVGLDGSGAQGIAGNIMAHWGWHSFPLPAGLEPADLPPNGTYAAGRPSGPDDFPPGTDAQRNWLFTNPHRLNLGRLRLLRADGRPVVLTAAPAMRQLDLWTGIHRAEYTLDGQPVVVETAVHGTQDAVGLRVRSPLVVRGELLVALDFGYPTLQNTPHVGDFAQTTGHESNWAANGERAGRISRSVDDARYVVDLHWSAGAVVDATGPHAWRWLAPGRDTLELTARFSPAAHAAAVPSVAEVLRSAAQHWSRYWRTGGAIDLSGSRDPRWRELERRIVLSQYQVGCQSAGSWPPAETGLLGLDPWCGQFHGEMIWWHLAHYALWDRWPLAERGLECYQRFIPTARALAAQLGLEGFAWPKSTGPEGRSAPWMGNQVLLWKQPHPIFFAELAWRDQPTRATLERWWPIVEGTAEYMVDYATRDAAGVAHLAPVMPPSEQGITRDTVFDLAYWRVGLDWAQRWRERAGLPPEPRWQAVRDGLAPLPSRAGLYVHSAEWTDTYEARNFEHPDPVGILGMLPPTDAVDAATATRTLERIWSGWQWERCWGWDFPWVAMAAARLGRPALAVDALLLETPRNHYDERGINVGGPCPYLPGNGGLLYAVALMAAGWDGAPDGPAPGFPSDGSWVVRSEGLRRAP